MKDINQIETELDKPLDKKHIKSRSKGGATLGYVEGWHVIAEANRIFGHLNWDRETILCEEVSRETNANSKHVIGYRAKVRISVKSTGVAREGTGCGSGIAGTLYDAIEGAVKEAETDAMKRALMTFGNPFGLALYDKDRAGVVDTAAEEGLATAILKGINGWENDNQFHAGLTVERVAKINELAQKSPELYEKQIYPALVNAGKRCNVALTGYGLASPADNLFT